MKDKFGLCATMSNLHPLFLKLKSLTFFSIKSWAQLRCLFRDWNELCLPASDSRAIRDTEHIFPRGPEKRKTLGPGIVLAIRAASIKRWGGNQTSVCKIPEHICSTKVMAVVKWQCCHSPRCPEESRRCWNRTDLMVHSGRAAEPCRDPQEGSAGSKEPQGSAAAGVVLWAPSILHTPGAQALASESPPASKRNQDFFGGEVICLFFLACNILQCREFWNMGKLTWDSASNLQRMVSLLCPSNHHQQPHLYVLFTVFYYKQISTVELSPSTYSQNPNVLSHTVGIRQAAQGEVA